MELGGRTVFVTGAGGGIGEALALRFAAARANVFITDVREEQLAATERQVREAGGSVHAEPGDLTDAATVAALVQAAVARFGGLDGAVNNAAFYPPDSDLTELDLDLARRVMDVDFWGLFHCMRAEIQAMRQRGRGSIVNIASGAGLAGFPRAGIYCAAKHAVVGITRSAAVDHSREGIRVNVICPGMIETPPLKAYLADPGFRAAMTALHPIGRLGQPDEIADAAVWLCSDASTFVTGVALPVDGGYMAV